MLRTNTLFSRRFKPVLAAAILTILVHTPEGVQAARKPKPTPEPKVVAGTLQLAGSTKRDPLPYLGRFFKDLRNIDEDAAVKTVCSEFIKPIKKEEGAASVAYDTRLEYREVSREFAAKLGIPEFLLGIKGSGDNTTTILVEYTIVDEVVTDVYDPAQLALCGLRHPDEYQRYFISAMVKGTGKVYGTRGGKLDVSAAATIPEGNGKIRVGGKTKWELTHEFTDSWFGYKLGDLGEQRPQPNFWLTRPPQSPDGLFFTGVSRQMPSAQEARDGALSHAREQVMKYLGETLSDTETLKEIGVGQQGQINTLLQSERVRTRASQAIVRRLKDEDWDTGCNAPRGGNPNFYQCNVLAYIPNTALVEEVKKVLAEETPADGQPKP